MKLESLQKRSKTEDHPKALKQFQKFEKLLDSLSQKELPKSVLDDINQQVDSLNLSQVDTKTYHKDLRKSYNDILKLLKKELKIVPKHYYRNMWLAVGMSSFGLPIGVGFGLAFDNMAFLAIGLPIGMSIGMAFGSGMDNKAKEEGKQLDIEI
ncbi:hypothetical protein [Mesohalobacter halotolerans]|uniref:Uncharacterized protein n=1 Tax=Mesohalobacter halotolerans TaxID=1883405 RepID=A0A4U5TTB8_9FLAO|nr:hypothetical protein [Mesohalobacter halotolerans]MBS3737586.1 hypothetical protein [Psychroflexus sp.]TKS57292.1 hypothetical protein FCN74_02415 [Mesohalobacter halotolerans]